MTHFAWVVLHQLSFGRIWDGDLVCKSGRTELVNLGLAERGYGYQWLTKSGQELAAKLSSMEGTA